jgi:hypothetical protein
MIMSSHIFRWAIVISFLIGLGSIAQTQKPAGCGDNANSPWSKPAANCRLKQKPFHYYQSVGFVSKEEVRCKEVLEVCGARSVREQDLPRSQGCGKAFWPEPTPADEVCCDTFKEAVKSKRPCDPTDDADCDGIPNENDSDPFKQSCDPCLSAPADDACNQLGENVSTAYKEAGSSETTAHAAGQRAIKDCAAKKCEAKKNPKPAGAPIARVTCNPGPEGSVCCELEIKVSKAYLAAGASVETALDAGNFALLECRKKNTKKD